VPFWGFNDDTSERFNALEPPQPQLSAYRGSASIAACNYTTWSF